MPKDTKSSGYNKAPACESRGFGDKKEGENFDTPSSFYPLSLHNHHLKEESHVYTSRQITP